MSETATAPYPGWRLAKPGEQPTAQESDLVHEASKTRWIGPRSTASPSLEQESKAASVGRWLKETAIRSALPTAGAIGGGLAGGLVGGWGAIPGGIAGGMAGLKANELLGIETPTLTDYGIEAVGGALPGLGRGAVKLMGGAAAGMQELGQRQVGKIVSRLAPTTPSSALYRSMPAGVQVPLRATAQVTADLAAEMLRVAPAIRTGATRKLITAANELVDQAQLGGLDPTTLTANVTQFGRIVGKAARTGAVHGPAASKIRNALLEDLEAAATRAGSPHARMLREAATAYKQELASGRVAEILGSGAKGTVRSRQGLLNLNWDQAANKVMADRDLTRWMSTDDLAGLVKELRQYAKTIPNIATAAGPGVAGQTYAERALFGGVAGEAVRGLAGSSLPVGTGFALGATANVLVTEALGRFLVTAPGRSLVRGLVSRGAPYQTLAALGQFGAAGQRRLGDTD